MKRREHETLEQDIKCRHWENVKQVSHLPPRNLHFTGREKEFEKIHQSLSSSNRQQTVTLHGLAGVGKSQLALEYAHRHRNQYQFTCLISCSTGTAENCLIRLAKDLKIDVETDTETLSENNVKNRLYDFFKILDSSYLLIFDHVHCDVMKYLFSEQQRKSMQHVIITTHSPQGCQNLVELDVFSDEDAFNYVSARLHAAGTSDADNNDGIIKLCDLLCQFPLALSQAVAHIRTRACSVETYIENFRSVRTEMFTKGVVFDNHYERAVFATMCTSIGEVVDKEPFFQATFEPEEEEEEAINLLKCFSLIDSDNIPLWLFQSHSFFASEDKGRLLNAIAKLKAFGLIAPSQKKEHYRINKLVQHVVRPNVKEALFVEKLLVPLTSAIASFLPKEYESCVWKDVSAIRLEQLRTLAPQIRALLVHVNEALKLESSHEGKIVQSDTMSLQKIEGCKAVLLKVAGYSAYYRRGFKEGVSSFRDLLELQDHAGMFTANYKLMLGKCLVRIPEQQNNAIKYLDEALDVVLQDLSDSLDDQHPGFSPRRKQILITVAKAKAKYFNDECDDARRLLEEARELQQSYLLGDKELNAYILSGLGNVAYKKERFEVAEKHYMECLETRSKYFECNGENHGHILVAASMFAVAKTLMSLKRYSKSEILFLHCLDSVKNHLGDDHACVGKVYGAIGKCLIHQKQFPQASQYLRNSLLVFSTTYGEDSKAYKVVLGWWRHATDPDTHSFSDEQCVFLLAF